MQSIGKIIAHYRKKNGLSQQDLSNLLGNHGYKLTNKAISSWEKDSSEPSASLLMLLCKLLGISDIYGEYYESNPNNPLSDLNEEGYAKTLDYIQLLKCCDDFVKKSADIIPFTRKIKLFNIPASAGTGNFLDGDDYTELEVGDEVPTAADFGIRISGDSMEPQFINNQIVWVQQQTTLEHGEIGIFYLNGNAYCKKLHNTNDELALISLNKKYSPIIIGESDSFKVFGKVV